MVPLDLCKTVDHLITVAVSVEWLQLGDRGSEYRMRRQNHCSFDEIL
jgi:hypothetical protein